jgi:hypothetical protein
MAFALCSDYTEWRHSVKCTTYFCTSQLHVKANLTYTSSGYTQNYEKKIIYIKVVI